MIEKLVKQLNSSPTAYHVVDTAQKQLEANGFKWLDMKSKWKLSAGDKAFVTIDGSALIAFCVGEASNGFNIVASHTDSPCFKIKYNPVISDGISKRLSVESYGSALNYTWLDRPLGIAGRLIVRDKKSGNLKSVLINDSRRFVIPSVAIHQNREANKSLVLDIRKDLLPLFGAHDEKSFLDHLIIGNPNYTLCDFDLYLYSACQPFVSGTGGEFFSAPRLDNQTSAFASLEALLLAKPKTTAVCFLADNEEVGSRTKQGAGATALSDVLRRISTALGANEQEHLMSLCDSFMVSCDNAHAVHPNRSDISDGTNKNYLGHGVVIKHHAGQSYTSDAFSSAIIKQIFESAGISYQDFFNRSDLPSGGTLGAISSTNVSIRSVDIGLPQLAMHSAVETMSTSDYAQLITGLTKFFDSSIVFANNEISIR